MALLLLAGGVVALHVRCAQGDAASPEATTVAPVSDDLCTHETLWCKMYCEHGWAVNELGCEVCACHECEPLACRMDCPYGLAQDERGCDMCQCSSEQVAPGPSSGGCPGVMCAMWCESGFAINPETGCEECRCNVLAPSSDCPQVPCRMYCEHGWAVNETTGCEYCGCHECEPLACRMDCPYGLAQDERACDTCACANATAPSPSLNCSSVACDMWCEHGFAVDPDTKCEHCQCHECGPLCDMYCEHGNAFDERGCELCECLVTRDVVEGNTTQAQATPEAEATTTQDGCAPVLCKMFCQNGWAVDPDTGCEICGCAGSDEAAATTMHAPEEATGVEVVVDGDDCPDVMCLMYCVHGWALDADTNCPMCQCHECPPLCEIACHHGHVLDDRGCETCACRQSPPCPTDRSAGDADENMVSLCDGTTATAAAAVGVVAAVVAVLFP